MAKGFCKNNAIVPASLNCKRRICVFIKEQSKIIYWLVRSFEYLSAYQIGNRSFTKVDSSNNQIYLLMKIQCVTKDTCPGDVIDLRSSKYLFYYPCQFVVGRNDKSVPEKMYFHLL